MYVDPIRRRVARFGWSWLLAWAVVGLGLETAHGFKVAPYLDDPLTRQLCTLAHAHGVGLSLLVLVFGHAGLPWFDDARAARRVAAALIGAAGLIPLGFALGAFEHPEGDPSLGIVLVPVGGLLLLAALGRTAWAAWWRDVDRDG